MKRSRFEDSARAWKRMQNASAILERLDIDPSEDFHALPSSAVDRILQEADRVHYRKPRNANGSRARYFHAKLCREARMRRVYEFFVRVQA